MPLTWVELRTDDVTNAKAFLEASFGWTSVGVQVGGVTYYKFKDANNVFRAGLFPDAGAVRWITYIWIDEPDSVVTSATQNGGSVVAQGTNHPVLGTWAIIEGPGSARFGVMNGTP